MFGYLPTNLHSTKHFHHGELLLNVDRFEEMVTLATVDGRVSYQAMAASMIQCALSVSP